MLVTPEVLANTSKLVQYVKDYSCFNAVFPNLRLGIINIKNAYADPQTCKWQWKIMVVVGDTMLFNISRFVDAETYQDVVELAFEPFVKSFDPIQPAKQRFPTYKLVDAFDYGFNHINNALDAAVKDIEETIASGSDSWIFEHTLKKIWNFRLGLS